MVGKSEQVESVHISLYREIARLVEKEFRSTSCHVRCLDDGAEYGAMVVVGQLYLHVVYKLEQKRGRSRCSPIVLDILVCQSVDKAEWVVDINHVATTEVIAVVVGLQANHCLLLSPSVRLAHRLHFRTEIVGYLLGSDTADGCKRLVETDVAEIVENGEEGDLRELRDAGDENETFVLVVGFQNGEHFAVDRCTRLMVGHFPGMLQWRVVLVYQYRHRLASLLAGGLNDCIEAVG